MVDYGRIIKDFETKGYSNIPISKEYQERITSFHRISKRFFSSGQAPTDVLSSNFISGYRDIGTEYSQHPSRMDLMKAISLPVKSLKKVAKGLSNEFESSFNATGSLFFELAEELTSALNKKYGDALNAISCSTSTSFFQVSFYEPHLHERDTLQDTHEDGNLFTLVWGSAPSLEIVKNDYTVPIDFQKNEIYLMPGRILSLLTGNKIQACDHVVKCHNHQLYRVSFMCFVNPSIHKSIKPWIHNDYNSEKNINEEIQFHSTKFGLPPIKSSNEQYI